MVRGTFYYNQDGQRKAKSMSLHEECRKQGCKYLDACTLNFKAQELKNLSEGKAMSQALWCDDHDGPFSAKDPDQQSVTRTTRDADGNEVQETYTMCGTCSGVWALGVRRQREQARTPLAAPIPHDEGPLQ